MARDFYPRQEGTILSFTRCFAQRIEADPERYGLSVEQCAEYAVTQQAFAQAYGIASDPATATRPARAGKNAARVALEDATRRLARIIRANPAVNREMRIELGLNAADVGEGGAAIGRPEQVPNVVVTKIAGREIQLELWDEAGKVRRPRGTSGAVIFVSPADEPGASLASWRFMGIATKARKTLSFGAEFEPGAKVWILALPAKP